MLIVVRNIFNFLIFLIIDFFIGLTKATIKPKTLLILRFDSIGDYILFRNFLKFLKEDEKYKEYKITLCGNIVWKELAEKLDCGIVDEFIWLERNKFLFNIGYKISFLKMIHSKGFETVINSTYTRELLFGDQIVKSSRAIERIGSSGSPDKKNRIRIFSNNFYTRLIQASDINLFEFYRNKEFFERLLNKKLELNRPIIESDRISSNINLPREYFIIFPGANHNSRIWSQDNFTEICKFLISEYRIPVYITGSEKEESLAHKIKLKSETNDVIDISGKTSLSQLAKIIAGTKLLITNDTGALHIAVAVNTPFICISNGNHFGRFTPYPAEIYNRCRYLYPPEIMNNLNKPEELISKYRFKSTLDINSIKVEQVKQNINELIN